jgi:hypothetical protein
LAKTDDDPIELEKLEVDVVTKTEKPFSKVNKTLAFNQHLYIEDRWRIEEQARVKFSKGQRSQDRRQTRSHQNNFRTP